jgi:uncharacterized C2H2 Zn-finger protein
MPYVICPRCHASFHTGLLYVSDELCPRCGAPFHQARRNFRDHLRIAGFRHSTRITDAVDWEAITGAQYAARQYVSERHRKLDR